MNKMYEYISSFEKKLTLFKTQLSITTLTHFPTLAVRKAEIADLDSSKYAENVDKLCTEFTSRFADLGKFETDFKLFSQPFDVAPEDSSDCYQMELIDLQSDMVVMTW